MKTKKADFVYKIFFIVVGVILSGLLIAWLVGTYKDKKREADAGTQKINSVTSSMADFDLTVYDGMAIKGEALKELITTLKNREVKIAVRVITLEYKASKKKTDYIYEYDDSKDNISNVSTATFTDKKTDSNYITPSGNFLGKVMKNKNNEIVCLSFEQQK